MADDSEESASQQEPSLPEVQTGLRNRFCIGVIAGENVELSGFEEHLKGASDFFQVVTKSELVAVEDETLAAEVSGLSESESPIEATLFGKLLAAHLGRPASKEELSLPDGERPSEELCRIKKGPREFCFCFDFPQTVEQFDALQEEGQFDAIFLVSAPAKETSQDEEDGPDGAPTRTKSAAFQESTEDEPEGKPSVGRVKLFEDLKRIAETQGEKTRSQYDVAFGTVLMLEDLDETLDAFAQTLSVIVKAKIEYLDWTSQAPVVETFPAPIDLRHYDTSLSALKPSCVSVPLILNALVEQVCLIAAPSGSARQSAGDKKAASRGNKAILQSMETALYSLNAHLPPRQVVEQKPKASIPIFLYGDDQAYRMGEPSIPQAARDAFSEQENQLTRLRDPIPLKHPPQPGMNAEEVGLELTELLTMTPPGVSAKQVSRALLLSEFERMVGFRTDDKGDPNTIDGWVMSEVSLESFIYQEHFDPHALQQVVAAALSPAMGLPLETVTSYYPREDLVLVALCNQVPFSRVAEASWRAELPGFLGFWQWLQQRFEAADAERRRIEEEESRLSSAKPQAEDGDDGDDAQAGADAGTAEAEVSGEDSKVSQAAAAPLPLPPPPRGPVFRMDRERARLWDERRVLLLAGGARVCVGEAQSGKYIAVDAAPHLVHLRQEVPRPDDEARSFAVSVVYEDGASVLARRDTVEGYTVVTLGLPSGLTVTLRSDGVVSQCRPSARALAPLDWTRYCKEEEQRPRPRGQVVVEGDVAKAVVAKAELESVRVVGDGCVLVTNKEGETDILMPAGSAGSSLGVGCGWLWTNPAGQRQIRGAPRTQFALPAPPVEVKEKLQPESGEVVTVRSDLVLSVETKDGALLVQHADGTQVVSFPPEEEHPGPTRHVLAEGMATVQLGPDLSHRSIMAEDGTELSLLGQHIMLVRPDGSRLQVAVSGGKVVFLPEGDMQQQERHKNPDGASLRSRKSRMQSTHGSGADDRPEQSVRGSQEGAVTARTAHSDTRSVKSHTSRKSGKSEATTGAAGDGWGAGAYVMSMVTGSFHTEDVNGNVYSVTSKGELKNTVKAVQALKQRNADAVSAADEARNKMAMDTSGLSDLRPPSPKIEAEPGPRLEPFRLLCVRRDGSGFELLNSSVAERRIRLAKLSGMTVMEEEMEDEGAGAVSVTILQPDFRGSRQPTPADRLLPSMVQHHGLKPRPADATLKALRMSNILRFPALDRPTMQKLRLASPSHLDWRSACAEAADALYVPDPRPVEKVDVDSELQQRIAEARRAIPGRTPSAPPSSRHRRASAVQIQDTAPLSASASAHPRRPSASSAAASRPSGSLQPAPPPPHTATTQHTTATGVSGSVAVVQEPSGGSAGGNWDGPGAPAMGGRIFVCEPGEAWFGELAGRRIYRLRLSLLNKSPFLAKFRIRQPKTSSVSVVYSPAPVAAGMSVPLEVEVRSWPPGEINDTLKVVSEEDEFAVPILAQVVDVGEEQVEDGGYMQGTSNQVMLTGMLQKSFTVKPKVPNATSTLPGATTTQTLQSGTFGATQMERGMGTKMSEVEEIGRTQRLRQTRQQSGLQPQAEAS